MAGKGEKDNFRNLTRLVAVVNIYDRPIHDRAFESFKVEGMSLGRV